MDDPRTGSALGQNAQHVLRRHMQRALLSPCAANALSTVTCLQVGCAVVRQPIQRKGQSANLIAVWFCPRHVLPLMLLCGAPRCRDAAAIATEQDRLVLHPQVHRIHVRTARPSRDKPLPDCACVRTEGFPQLHAQSTSWRENRRIKHWLRQCWACGPALYLPQVQRTVALVT